MVSYDWVYGGSVGVFFRHGMILGLWGELVLFQGMGMKFKDKIVSQGWRKGYCEYGPTTGILCWVYTLSESYLISKADSHFWNP